MKNQKTETEIFISWIIKLVFAVFVLIGVLMALLPRYSVYSAHMEGKAKLAEAEYARQVQVKDAEGKLNAAQYLKKAADEIQSSLSAEYLQYLSIQMQEEIGREGNAVYFFPTSAPNIVVNPDNATKKTVD